jgi:hypothetical protein
MLFALRNLWLRIQLKLRYMIRLAFSFLHTYYIEHRDKYLILYLKNAGVTIGKIYLPVDNSLRGKKVFLSSKDIDKKEGKQDLVDITHPFCIKYFLEPEDLNGQYFLIYEKENQSIKKAYSSKEINECQRLL